MRYPAIILSFLLLVAECHLVTAQDNEAPEWPDSTGFISYVSVDTATNHVEICWRESPSSDVWQYYIYYEIKTVNGWEGVKLGSIPAGNSSYTDTINDASQHHILYSVTAIDSSGNESLRKPELYSTKGLHSTIHAKVFYDSCNHAMVVSWNKYRGWNNNVAGYRIYGREDGGSYQVITGTNADDSSYIIPKIKINTHYYYYIEAIKNDGLISRSNIVHKYTYAPDPPEIMIIEYATVIDENTVEIKFKFSDTSEVDDFALLRSSVINADFNQVRTILNADTSPFIINDSFLTGHTPFYYYRIGALNSCLSVIDTSNLACNILLSGSNTADIQNSNNINTLKWNKYLYFPSDIKVYELYRQYPSGYFNLIETIDPSDHDSDYIIYEDNIDSLSRLNYSGRIAYKVHAVEDSTGGNISVSNICTIDIRTDMHLPNAFTPNQDGKNDYFKPVMDFIPEKYLMMIYNRYGIIIFKSTDPETGWDGKINGDQRAPEGVYIYHIEYTSYTGQKKVVKPGTVTLFYP